MPTSAQTSSAPPARPLRVERSGSRGRTSKRTGRSHASTRGRCRVRPPERCEALQNPAPARRARARRRLVGLVSAAVAGVLTLAGPAVAARATPATAGGGSPLPDISPNGSTLPGTGTLVQLLGGLQMDAVLAAIAGIVIGAAVWALSSHSGQYQGVSRGRAAVLVSALAAVLIGFGPQAVQVLFHLGQTAR